MGRKKRKELSKEMRYQVKGIILIALALFSFAGLILSGETGLFGVVVNTVLRTLAGDAAPVVPVFMLLLSLRYLLPRRKLKFNIRVLGFITILITVIIWVHFRLILTHLAVLTGTNLIRESILIGWSREGGGVIGGMLAAFIYNLVGQPGGYILLASLAIIAILMIFNISLNRLTIGTGKIIKRSVKSLKSYLTKTAKKRHSKIKTDRAVTVSNSLETQQQIPVTFNQEEPLQKFSIEKEDLNKAADNHELNTESNSQENIKSDSLSSIVNSDSMYSHDYIFPPIEFLTVSDSSSNNYSHRYAKERARLLEETLNSFGVRAKVIHVQSGPTVTRFELQPESGVKVSKIINLSDDIALNLAAPLVRIEAPIPGKAALGIEVPNKIVDLVSLREVVQDLSFQDSVSPLSLALGKDITGIAVIADLAKMPHLLIAGSTGAGKSVCLNTLITSVIYKAGPDKVRFLLIDPKVVELSIYNGIPHLLAPVVTDPRKASLALKNMVKEMAKRYEMFASVGVRDINAYNEMAERDSSFDKFPLVVIIIDELADLMLVAPGEVEDSIARLAQMSRAAGIHLIIATQRPSVDVLTGVIKANITSRIAFTVSSQFDSRTILDMAGAEKLLGRGDMLFYPVGSVKPFRVQGAFISDTEVKNVTDFLRANCTKTLNDEHISLESNEEQENEKLDDLYGDAVELVVNTGQASISLLQRRFRIGYARAARLIDDLELRGIVGKFEGSKPREVLVTQEYVDCMKEEKEKDNN